jgi:hypothetical protein
LACHLQIDADPDPDPSPAYHFDSEPDPDFYSMRMRIRVPKMMRIHADPDPQHCPPNSHPSIVGQLINQYSQPHSDSFGIFMKRLISKHLHLPLPSSML